MWGYVPHTPTREFLPGPGTQWGLDLKNQRVSVWGSRNGGAGESFPCPPEALVSLFGGEKPQGFPLLPVGLRFAGEQPNPGHTRK